MEWQPIETAPKTTRHILVWLPAIQCTAIASWWDDKWTHAFGGSMYPNEPTHWMPLPAPPQEDREPPQAQGEVR